MNSCPYCKNPIEGNGELCANCGKPLLANMEINPKKIKSPFSNDLKQVSLREEFYHKPYYYIDEAIEEELSEITKEIEKKETSGEPIPGSLLLKKSGLLYKKRELTEALKTLEITLKIFQDDKDLLNISIVNNEMGIIQEELGFFDAAVYHFEMAIESLISLNDFSRLIQVYNNIGNVYYLLKDIEHAYEFYNKALILAQKNNLILAEMKTASNLVDTLFILKENDRIERILERNLGYFKLKKDIYGTIITLSKLGKFYFNLREDKSDKAYEYINEAIKMINNLSNDGQGLIVIKAQLEWENIFYLGRLYLAFNDYIKAENYFLKSLESIRTFEVEDSINEGIVLENLAQLYELKGEYLRSIEYYELCAEIYSKYGDEFKKAELKTKIAHIYADLMEEKSESIRFFEEALIIFEELEFSKEMAEVLHKIGDIYIQKNNIELALSNFKRAKDIFNELQDQFNSELINEKIRSLE